MARHDVVVIGASSGGVEALLALVGGLSSTFQAAVFVVLHVAENRESHLPAILNRGGALPAAHAVDEEPVRSGRIYVAPPGLQMYVHPARLRVRRGPVENLHRPAIDVLFRTAAHYYGPRVVGVVLSGSLDDGAAGLAAIKAGGGITVVQDPHDAKFPDMPMHALQQTDADYVLPAAEIAAVLSRLTGTSAAAAPTFSIRQEVALETIEEAEATPEAHRSDELGNPSEFTCPDCAGTLYEIADGARVRYRCRVGHAYSEATIVEAQNASLERALWAALRALEERHALLNKMAGYAQRRGHHSVAELFATKAQQVDADAKAIHHVVTSGHSLDPVGQDVA